MAPQKRVSCQICQDQVSKYTCAQCSIVYCSVACFKKHKETSCAVLKGTPRAEPGAPSSTLLGAENIQEAEHQEGTHDAAAEPPKENKPAEETALPDPAPPLRPLTSLRWPYVPEPPAYPDPLKRDDPKPLQLPQYEAIATSPAVRRALASSPQLPALLRSIDVLRGSDREDALERVLGVSAGGPSAIAGHTEEDTRALRALAEAVEAAVRGGKQDVLGLDWGDS